MSFWVLWFAFVCFWLCLLALFFGFVLEDTLLLLSPILQHVGIVSQKPIRFDDRLSLERALHQLKKKRVESV